MRRHIQHLRAWSDILINELLVTSYESSTLRVVFIALVTSYKLLFIARITSYLLHTSYKLHFIARVTSYCLHASYELLLIARVTSYLFHECYELPFIVRVTLLKVFLLHYHWPICKKLTEWRRVYQHEEKKNSLITFVQTHGVLTFFHKIKGNRNKTNSCFSDKELRKIL